MRSFRIVAAVISVFSFSAPLLAAEVDRQKEQMEQLTRGLAAGETIELRALEIRAKIHEPSVIYILDRSRLEVDYEEQTVRFTPRIAKPIRENRF
jgi:hypothetical protein